MVLKVFFKAVVLMLMVPLFMFARLKVWEDKNSKCCDLYCGGFWIGGQFASYCGDDWTLAVGWSSEYFLVDFGYSYKAINPNTGGFSIHELRSHLGLRYRVYESNLFLTGGALGSYGIRDQKNPAWVDPYEVGLFIGLDYQLSRHFLISGKIAPYTYKRTILASSKHNVFAEGSFTFSYVF